MIAPIPNYTDYIKSESTSSEENRGYTSLPKVPKKPMENQLTTPRSQEESYPNKLISPNEYVYPLKGYTEQYISFNVYLLMRKIDSELAKWQNLDTEEALPYISNIKDMLNVNEPYLIQNSNSRILLSLLELLFENNNWERIDKHDLNFLRNELNRFEEGEIKIESLKNFSKQLYRKKYSLIKESTRNEKKKTNKD